MNMTKEELIGFEKIFGRSLNNDEQQNINLILSNLSEDKRHEIEFSEVSENNVIVEDFINIKKKVSEILSLPNQRKLLWDVPVTMFKSVLVGGFHQSIANGILPHSIQIPMYKLDKEDSKHLAHKIAYLVNVASSLNLSIELENELYSFKGSRIQKIAHSFKYKGDLIFIIGYEPENKLTLKDELDTARLIQDLVEKKLINVLNYCSLDGLFKSLAESSVENSLGFDIVTDSELSEAEFLFGSSTGRYIVTVEEDFEEDFIERMMESKISFTLLGHVTQGKMVVDDEHFGFSKDLVIR